ncbi:MAG TPA: class I SAM-dependent methyltransferase, partial [Ktedonobacterales bacterium]
MEHADHVRLLRDGVLGAAAATGGAVWADLGAGTGAFTLALADLLGPGAEITAVDKDRGALAQQEAAMRARFPGTRARYLVADFTQPLALPPLDGLVMANSPHFVKKKEPVLQ